MSRSNAAIPLSVSGLNKRYGDFPVLKDLALELSAGAVHGLVGLNGSGKTTTIECILGLQGFQSGRIEVLGRAPSQLHLSAGRVVAIFDTPSLHPNLTVRQCLDHARLLCPKPTRAAAEVEELLGIARFRDFKIRHLSLGNKRRASIAQALLGDPELILLDEPFNGLDAGGVDDVLQLIRRLNREQETTFLLSSHQLPYLEQICSHIAILHQGQIVESGRTLDLLDSSTAVVKLGTSQPAEALALLERESRCRALPQSEEGYITVELLTMDSAALNSLLVQSAVPVSELVVERASLSSLFRRLTSQAPEPGDEA